MRTKTWNSGMRECWVGCSFHSSHIPPFHHSAIPFFLFLCCFLPSCSDSRFPDFSHTKNDLYYKIQDIGDGERKAKPGDYVTAQIVIRSEKDSVLYDTKRFGPEGSVTFLLPGPQFEKDYREGFQLLSEGDSATFITDAYTICLRTNHQMVPHGMNLQSVVKVETRVLRIRTPEEHVKDLAEEKAKLDAGEFEEKKERDKYLAACTGATCVINGMVYIKLQEGNGLTPDSGRVALINYKGYFLNGRCFDSSFETQPFEYVVGAEEQLIRGLEIGLRRMHEGEKAKFIIPSHLAFGSSGSSTGIVPPFTTVVYEVELLKVQ